MAYPAGFLSSVQLPGVGDGRVGVTCTVQSISVPPHTGIGLPTLVTNKCPQACPLAHVMEAFSQPWPPLHRWLLKTKPNQAAITNPTRRAWPHLRLAVTCGKPKITTHVALGFSSGLTDRNGQCPVNLCQLTFQSALNAQRGSRVRYDLQVSSHRALGAGLEGGTRLGEGPA